MSVSDSPFFDPNVVSQVLCINHPEIAKERWETFSAKAKSLNIIAERIPAIYGSDLSEAEQRDVISRTKARFRDQKGNGIDSLETNRLFNPDTASQEIINNALAKYGCQASHVRAMEYALAHIPPHDNRWVIILEDDAQIDPEYRQYLNDALCQAPKDAGAMMLGGIHRLWSGYVPIATGDERFVIPSQCTTTTAIAYRPEMLRLLLATYKRNMGLSIEDGGISSVDYVNAVIQEKQALGHNPERHEHQLVVDAFEQKQKETNAIACRFYALNPLAVDTTGQASTISTATLRPHIFAKGQKLVSFSSAEAKQLRTLMKSLDDTALESQSHRIIDKAAKDGIIKPEEAIAELQLLRNSVNSSPRKDQHTNKLTR